MPKKNKNRGNYQNKARHNQVNGGGIQKSWSGQNNRNNNGSTNNGYNNNNRKTYFKPSLINALEAEDEYEMRNQNDNYQNNRDDQQNGDYQSSRNRKNKKNRRNKVLDQLKDMGLVKPKLAIGDDDTEIKKKFIESKPHCKLSSLPDDVFGLIVNFVQNYFTCFDSNRQDLLGAYHPKVFFSLTLNMSNSCAHRQYRFDEALFKENRNLKRLVGNDPAHREKRLRLIHQDYIDTVSFLSKLPSTEHEPASFKLDNFFFTPNMITFSVNGVLREGKLSDKVRPLRSFSRVFVCVPNVNAQMTIINEQFTLSNITDEQYKIYYSEKDKLASQQASEVGNENVAPSAASVASSSGIAMPTSDPNAAILVGLNEAQIQMVREFSVNSRLNFEWCKYCLEHSGWNFEEAAKNFLAFKDSIPAEAFIAV